MNRKNTKYICTIILLLLFMSNVSLFATEDVVQYAINNKPRVLVTNYNIVDGSIQEGVNNQLEITIKNMNANHSVYSVVVNYIFSPEAVYPVYGETTQIYIEEIKPLEEVVLMLDLEAVNTINEDRIDCKISLSYIDDGRNNGSSESRIFLPVNQEYFNIYRADFPANAIQDTEARVSIIFENTGKTDIFNTELTVKGSSMEDKTLYIGELQSGSRKNQEMYVEFNSDGEQYISVEFTYEDTRGNQLRTQSNTYRVNVAPLVTQEEKEIVVEEQVTTRNLSRQQFVYILGLIIAIVGAMLSMLVTKYRR